MSDFLCEDHYAAMVSAGVLAPFAHMHLWDDVRFVEDKVIDWEGGVVSAENIRTGQDFEPLLRDLEASRPSWLEFSALGVWRNTLVVAVIVSGTKCSERQQPLVSYSGMPQLVTARDNLDLRRILRVQERPER